MAQFQFEKMLKDMTQFDGPLQNTPQARWQRKAQETLIRVCPADNGVSRVGISSLSARTPGKSFQSPGHCKTPSRNAATPGSAKKGKTPKALFTPGKQLCTKTPIKKSAMTPGKQQDRYIPNRVTTNQDMSHFALVKCYEDEGKLSSLPYEYQQRLRQAMLPRQPATGFKILSFRNICTVQGQVKNLNGLYSTAKVPVKASVSSVSSRYIPAKPENVLDAPQVMDDYYLHTLDWSSKNIVAAALSLEVYLWNATDSTITQLMHTGPGDYISSVSWVKDGSFLAVGIADGSIEIWDVSHLKMLRSMTGHSARVGCLDWNTHILTSGSRSGDIHHHDVRVAAHHVATLPNHNQEVCGLKWSPDGQFLASGGNDNTVYIWDSTLGMGVAPLYSFTDHQSAVKAISWCPWQPRILATGGGTSDRRICFWNTNMGSCINSVDTQSQVCSVLWSKEHREIVSGHGYTLNQLSLWNYPAMTKVTDLVGHSERILNLCMSPDSQTVASMAADETIRLWKCFAHDKTKEKKLNPVTTATALGLRTCIR